MTIVTTPPAVPDLLGTAPADLIDRYVDAPQSTRDAAVRRAERIRAGMASYAAMRQDIADAYAQRDWLALGYVTWHEYVQDEFGGELRKLARDDRRQAVADMRGQGMSTRQIAGATGVSHEQVRQDLKQVSSDLTPATVNGSDGKQYPASRPSTPDTTNVPAGRDQESPGSSPISTPDRPGADTPQGGDGGGATRDAGGTPPTAGAPAPRPKPPAWDPAEREAHEADVRRRQDIEAARRTAATFVTTIQAEIATIVTGYRLGERGLVTREQIAQIRNVVDLLEKELDREDG